MSRFEKGEVVVYHSTTMNLMYYVYVGNDIFISEYGSFQRFIPDTTSIYKLSEKDKVVELINNDKNTQADILKGQLKPTNRVSYQDEIDEKYKEIKFRIIRLADSIAKHSADESDYSNDVFEDMIKEMHQLKKQLFEIKCDGVEDARKHNGTIKYKIRELIQSRDYNLGLLDKIPDKFKLLVDIEI